MVANILVLMDAGKVKDGHGLFVAGVIKNIK